MQNVERILADLLSEFNTLKAEQRTYKLILDDIISTTSARYVTEATAGFFPDTQQPAFHCVRAAVYLSRAAQVTGKDQIEALEAALNDLEKAAWDGVDMNTKKFKPNFLKLRQDANARSADEFNHKLGELYNYAGDMFEMARGNGVPEIENIFTAIAQIVVVVSIPNKPPFAFSEQEREEAMGKAEKMVKFSLKTSQQKYA